MLPVDASTMLEIAPRFTGDRARRQAAIVAEAGAVLRATLAAAGIDTRLRLAHFLAQACHESDGFCTTEEFASGEAYEGRRDLGNTQPGDGPRYKGRGLIQLTGRANYRDYGQALGLGLEDKPALAAEPALSLRIACEFWTRHRINAACDADDVVQVTRLVNGGLNGLDSRRALTARAKAALARMEALMQAGRQAPPDADHPILHRGATGEAVAALQRLLRAQGFALAVDGAFGPATELAVARFQSGSRLPQDGVVAAATWAALEAAPVRQAG